MRISASDLSMSGVSRSFARHERQERLEMWVGQRPQERPRAAAAPADFGLGKVLEQAAKSKQSDADREQLDPELQKLLTILEKVFGMKGAKKFVLRMQALSAERSQAEAQAREAASQPQRVGWGLEYELHERTIQTQSASLTAEAVLTLDDGSTLAFRLDWSQESVQVSERSVRVALGDPQLKDPLVLDLDGDGIRFSGELATLDLDRDGSKESVARPAGADRIVALDGEILGAQSGQAFSDLAALDDDGNGWIDGGDAAFGRLQLWDGLRFSSLAAGGVAAISTASVALPFQHRGDDGALQAMGRRGGVFLADDGRAGAVAQVDLVA